MENLSQNALKIDNRRQKTALYNNKGMNTKNKTLHILIVYTPNTRTHKCIKQVLTDIIEKLSKLKY